MVGIVPWEPEALAQQEASQRRERLLLAARPSSAAGARPAPAAAPGAVPLPRTRRGAEALDVGQLRAEQLPDAVRETIAEHRRRRGWQRVLPCPSDPERYAGLFQTRRAADVLVERAACAAAARVLAGAAASGGGE
ncbi:hypothetical protein Rsub_00566 [Raphidocelis subcapitata]|uniref:Uncharacterized protein n=1 Tax=Raphidocelis subcapitata TaxID=307507 RepID=A0A2V0NKJ6_9CHLO|nr:hypothetical protein Rsub_00566 [Raphidocelis subcapitata]|eukprot:GBF87854.1 hypothetical protein Rsub_00566 [Raphidocelis subcapitata]